MAKTETLLGLGILLVSAGSTALITMNYVNGIVCVGVGLGVLYLRGFIKD